MPTYEFRCPTGHDFDRFFRKISDAPMQLPCPECGQVGERRVSAGAGLLFKGSGFYITDYGKDGKKAQPTATQSKPSGEPGGGESGKPDGGKGEATTGDSKSKPTDKTSATKPESAAPVKESKPSTE